MSVFFISWGLACDPVCIFTRRVPSFAETNVDYDILCDIFCAEDKAVKAVTQPEESKTKSADEKVALLDARRSFSISIILTSLHTDTDKVRMRIFPVSRQAVLVALVFSVLFFPFPFFCLL
jgi:hypothetical protein